MMDHTELFVLLWLLPVVAQIIIPFLMLLIYSLMKTIAALLSLFQRPALSQL